MVYGDMKIEFPIANLSNQALLEETARLANATRRTTARLVAALAEVDARKLWADVGCSSLYTYCTQVLHFSEQEAYLRMEAARVVRQFPVVLDMLANGEITLTNVGLLKPHLTAGNHVTLLDAARGKSKREVARQVATLAPAGPTPTWISPLSADRFWISFEIGEQTYDRLQRATDLLRHAVPDGNVGEVFDRAPASLLRDLERSKFGATAGPRGDCSTSADSRYIAAWVRRRVWKRDGGRCAFVGTHGRCTETAFLEFHHIKPFACGGRSTVDNIELRCSAHNQREAELFFGLPTHNMVREASASYGELHIRNRIGDGAPAARPSGEPAQCLRFAPQLGPDRPSFPGGQRRGARQQGGAGPVDRVFQRQCVRATTRRGRPTVSI